MALGRMNTFIDIISAEPIKDAEGFVTQGDNVIASVRAYMEEHKGNEKSANMAAYSTATAMFRFRAIPGLTVDTSHFIRCNGIRYRIISTENIKGRGMYNEVTVEKQEGTVR